MQQYLNFETELSKIDEKIKNLKSTISDSDIADDNEGVRKDIEKLEKKYQIEMESIYSNLSPWEQVQVARHASRPHFKDYLNEIIDDFTPLAGDRRFAEDPAIIGGLGRFNGRSVMVIGQEKGNDTASRMKHNFGSPRPEGYRKAIRLMELAESYSIPVLSFVDTAGAYPGVGAEERRS